MKTKTVTVSTGPSLLGLLGIVFVVLKLCGVINWSWWYVTIPFWGGLAVALVLVLAGLLVLAVAESAGQK